MAAAGGTGEARKASARSDDRATVDLLGIAATLAEGRTADGLQQLDAFAASPDARPADVAFAPVLRGVALIETRRYREAAAQGSKGIENAATAKLPPFPRQISSGWVGRFSRSPPAMRAIRALHRRLATPYRRQRRNDRTTRSFSLHCISPRECWPRPTVTSRGQERISIAARISTPTAIGKRR